MIGRTLSHYRILEKIGAGGMSTWPRTADWIAGSLSKFFRRSSLMTRTVCAGFSAKLRPSPR